MSFPLPFPVPPWLLPAVAAGLALLVITLGVALADNRRRLKGHRARGDVLERELESTRRELTLLQQDQRLQTRFVLEFLELSKKMDSLASARELPQVLLDMVVNIFQPAQAVVLIKKQRNRGQGLTAVAVHPRTSSIQLGSALPLHEGELGVVVRSGRVLSREDLLQPTYQSTIVGKKQSLPGFVFSLGAPMVFKEELYGVLCISNPGRQPAASREVLGLIAQMGAMTWHNSAAYNEVQREAQSDKLTKVLNKISIQQALEREIMRALRGPFRTSILLFDLDNFKNYNDVNGHLAGDELLHDLAQLVERSTRDYDIVGRFGGEEFLVIFPGADGEAAMAAAEKVRKLIEGEPFNHREKQPLGCVSISGGVATFPENGRDAETLMRLADEALYSAKKSGRNRVARARELAVKPAPMRPSGTVAR